MVFSLVTPSGIFNYKVGEPWRDDDLTAPFTFSLLKDREEIREEEEEIRRNTPAVFYTNREATSQAESRIDDLFNKLTPVLNAYEQWNNTQRSEPDSLNNDSLNFRQTLDTSSIPLSAGSIQLLLDNYASFQLRFKPTASSPIYRRRHTHSGESNYPGITCRWCYRSGQKRA